MNAPAQPRDELALLSSLFVAYPDALLLVDEKGRIARSNPAASQLLGYSAEELLGMSVDALVPDAARARHAEYRQGYARTPRPRPMGLQTNLSARRKDGSEVMVEIALSPLQEQAQRFVVAAIRDVTQYPRVQQALQRARYAEHLAQLGRLAVDARDPQVVLDQVPAIAAGALHADAAMVYLLDRHDLDFRLVSGVGLLPGDALGMHLPDRPDSLPSLVLTQAHAVALPQPGLDLPTHCRETGMQAMLAAPRTVARKRGGCANSNDVSTDVTNVLRLRLLTPTMSTCSHKLCSNSSRSCTSSSTSKPRLWAFCPK